MDQGKPGFSFRPEAAFGQSIQIDGPTILEPINLNGNGGFCSHNHPEQNTSVLRGKKCVFINTVARGLPVNVAPVPKYDNP